jgi:hypothetical protein
VRAFRVDAGGEEVVEAFACFGAVGFDAHAFGEAPFTKGFDAANGTDLYSAMVRAGFPGL